MTQIQKQNYSVSILIISMIFAGTTYFVTKDLISQVDPVAIALYRFLFASVFLGLYLKLKKTSLFSNFRHGFVGGIFLWLFFVLQNIGLEFTTASNASFLTGLFVVFVPIISVFLKSEKFSILKAIELTISVLGLWVITGGLAMLNLGDVLSLIAALAYAFYHAIVDFQVRKLSVHPLTNAFQQFLTISTLSTILILAQERSFGVGDSSAVISLLYLIIVPTLGVFTIMNIAQKYLLPFTLSLILSLTTVFGAIFAWTLGGESVTAAGLIGGLLITLAVSLSPICTIFASNKSSK